MEALLEKRKRLPLHRHLNLLNYTCHLSNSQIWYEDRDELSLWTAYLVVLCPFLLVLMFCVNPSAMVMLVMIIIIIIYYYLLLLFLFNFFFMRCNHRSSFPDFGDCTDVNFCPLSREHFLGLVVFFLICIPLFIWN